MRRRRTTSLGFLLLHLLAPTLAPRAAPALPGMPCDAQIEVCSSATAHVRSAAAAPALSSYGSWALEAGRSSDRTATRPFTPGSEATVATAALHGARAAASTSEHHSVRAAIRAAEAGLSASPPRAPPVPA